MVEKMFQNLRATVDEEKSHKHQIASQKLAELTETFRGMNKENETLKSVISHTIDTDQGNQQRISQSIASRNKIGFTVHDFHR
jgi:hypothetical protein